MVKLSKVVRHLIFYQQQSTCAGLDRWLQNLPAMCSKPCTLNQACTCRQGNLRQSLCWTNQSSPDMCGLLRVQVQDQPAPCPAGRVWQGGWLSVGEGEL